MCSQSCPCAQVLPLLTALNIWDGGWPPFCAALAFELWEDADGRGRPDMVRVLYNRQGTVADRDDGGCFVELTRWSLPSFAALVAPQVPLDFEAECTSRSMDPKKLKGLQEGSQF